LESIGVPIRGKVHMALSLGLTETETSIPILYPEVNKASSIGIILMAYAAVLD
jgi:hypothetical protein